MLAQKSFHACILEVALHMLLSNAGIWKLIHTSGNEIIKPMSCGAGRGAHMLKENIRVYEILIQTLKCMLWRILAMQAKERSDKNKQRYLRKRLWRPKGFWVVEDPILSIQSVHIWRWCQPYVPAVLYSPEIFFLLPILIFISGWKE
jgi:hypothetical protein